MPERRAEAEWDGNLREGRGRLKLESGAFQGPYSFRDRFEDGKGTNPEELLGAAHAGCFSMALTAGLTAAGHPPGHIHTTATVRLERAGEGFAITKIDLATEASVPGIAAADFQAQAEKAKANCPVSKALAGTAITLTAKLV
ncbi:MAG: OsmC family protein [Candidatus Eisenbacteria bacterium]|uniref:OsmC family protein n=1 Tax=Eiseniibacteriota bacterium TaxID=2212470 RepID=A0A538TCW5_UNCEI|nr:MAG: OsmC family protein [Candidatus Eisenbacteria bacterium]TMQ61468.1 MAG: OsmC family protein [Candidatus Eisenbacteria bacterium]